MEKQERVEYYTLRPSLKQHFGRKVTPELHFDEWTDNKKVHQVLNNNVLTTTLKDKRVTKLLVRGNEMTVTTEEKGTIKQTLPDGIVLIWDENQGYIIPPYEMATLEEIEEDLKDMKEAYRRD